MQSQGQYQPYQSYQPKPAMQPYHRNLLVTIFLIVVSVLFPIVGHLILTVVILRDDLSTFEKIVWLGVIWLVWFLGPLIYLLVGQRKNRFFGGHALFDRKDQQPQYPRD